MKPIKTWRIWCIWLIASLYVPYQFLLQASPSVMIPELIKTFSITVIDIGVLSSCYFYSYIFLQIPSGALIDRYGARVILTITITLCAMACLLFAFSTNFLIAQVSRFLMGIVASTSVVAALYLASRWFSSERFGLLAGLMEMLGMLGGAVGQASLAKCVVCFGWRETMVICSLVGFLIAILVWVLVRDNPGRMPTFIQEKDSNPCSFSSALILICKNRQLWVNGFYCGLMFAMMSGFAGLWSVPYLMACYHLPSTTAAYYTSIVFIGAAAGGPLLGWFAGKLGHYRAIMVGCALSACSLFSFIIYTQGLALPLLAGLLFLLGFFCGAYTIAFIVTRENTSPDMRGTAMGFTNMMCILIGAPVIQPLIGYLLVSRHKAVATVAYHATEYRYALSALAICLFLATLSALLIRNPSP